MLKSKKSKATLLVFHMVLKHEFFVIENEEQVYENIVLMEILCNEFW